MGGGAKQGVFRYQTWRKGCMTGRTYKPVPVEEVGTNKKNRYNDERID